MDFTFAEQGYADEEANSEAASYGVTCHFRRLTREYAQLVETLKELHDIAFRIRMLPKTAPHF